MFLPKRMKKVRIATHETRAKALEASLLEAGVFHVSEVEGVLENYSDLDAGRDGIKRETSNVIRSLERVAEKFGLGEDKGMTSALFAPSVRPEVLTVREERKRVSGAGAWIAEIEKELGFTEREIERLSAEMAGLREALVLYEGVGPDAPLLVSTENLAIKAFRCRESAFERFSKACESGWILARVARIKRGIIFLVCAHREELKGLEEAAKKAGLEEVGVLPGETPGSIKKRLRGLEGERKGLASELQMRKEGLKKEFRVLKDLLKAQLERDAINSNLIGVGRIKIIEGFVPEEGLPELEKVEELCGGEVLIQDSEDWGEKETPPTALDNHERLRPFEILTNLYGTPRYREVDPTPFVAVFFLVFFGMMMGDVLRGLTLAALSAFIAWKGRGSVRDLGIVFLFAGLSASLWGVITGDLLGGAVAFIPPLYDPLKNPVGFILLSILIGAGHLLLGSLIGIYNNLREGRIKKAIGSQATWFLIFLGIASLLYGAKDLGYALLAGGICLMILLNGVMGVMGVVDVVGNTISYVRIVAISLSGTMIMQTFVIVAGLFVQVPVIGAGLYWAVVGVSHLFTIIISLFASFAHAVRLNFIEFFGRFYEDGGVKYKPVKLNRQFAEVKG